MDADATLYRRFLAGEEDALTALLKTYREGLVLYVNGIVKNIFDAEDIVQEVFITLFVRRPAYKAAGTFKAWLYTVARHKAIDFLRRKNRGREVSLEETSAEETLVEDAYAAADRTRALLRVLEDLRPEQKEILFLTYFEELPNKQAAKVMGKSVHAIETLNSRARAALRERLEQEGLTYEDL